MRRLEAANDSGSQGIGVMIIFVALVLVSATVSIILITFGQEVFQHSSDDAQNNEKTLHGKILVQNAVVTAIEFDGNNDPIQANIQLTIELLPGSSTVKDHLVMWNVLCNSETEPAIEKAKEDRWENSGNLEAATTATGDGGDIGAIEELEFGITYMITISLQHTLDSDDNQVGDKGGCPPNYQETHTLIFSMGGSGAYTSWDLRYDEKIEVGDYII